MTAGAGGVPARRSSPGGDVVTGSLEASGYHLPPGVALVETAPPRWRAYDVVVAQNAWNFVPGVQFRHLAAGYSPARRGLYRARRAVAALNASRAATTVTLSHHMAGLLARRGCDPVVSPVTLPRELCTASDVAEHQPDGLDDRPFVLVPGTLTPYKNADLAISLVGLLDPGRRPLLVLAGTDDGSGHRERLVARMAAAGLAHQVLPVRREEMTWLLRRAVATVVPSRLESLSFSLAEALALSPHVLASPLPVHREVAARLGREPVWLPPEPDLPTAQALLEQRGAPSPIDRAAFHREWDDLADRLRERSPAS